jgi:hypothetical protein
MILESGGCARSQIHLRVGVYVSRAAPIDDPLLRPRGFTETGAGLWHDVWIGQSLGIPPGSEMAQLAEVFDVIERAYHSFG